MTLTLRPCVCVSQAILLELSACPWGALTLIATKQVGVLGLEGPGLGGGAQSQCWAWSSLPAGGRGLSAGGNSYVKRIKDDFGETLESANETSEVHWNPWNFTLLEQGGFKTLNDSL